MPDRVSGDVVTFSTLSRGLTIRTGTSSSITHESATLSGSVDELAGYDSAECWFQWREMGENIWQSTTRETVTATGGFEQSIAGLDANTQYEYRARGTAEHEGVSTLSVGDIQTLETEPPVWEAYLAAEGTAEESELYVYDSREPGPVTLAINIHASEQTGIDALENIRDNWGYPVESGTLIVWPTPCPSAATDGTRTCNGTDLNTAFDLVNGPQTTVAQTIEDELVEWDVDYLCDLHSRTTLYSDGGEAHAVFPSDDGTTRPISQSVVDEINASYTFDTAEEWQVGNTVDEANAENDGMLATYAWEIHGIHSQIGITWEPWNDAEQTEQQQRFVATTLQEAGHTLGEGPDTLINSDTA